MLVVLLPKSRVILHLINLVLELIFSAACLLERNSLHRRLDESEEYVCIPAITIEGLFLWGVTFPNGTGEPCFMISQLFHPLRAILIPTATISPAATSSDLICQRFLSPAKSIIVIPCPCPGALASLICSCLIVIFP